MLHEEKQDSGTGRGSRIPERDCYTIFHLCISSVRNGKGSHCCMQLGLSDPLEKYMN